MRYLCLLRGLNVSGQRKIAMNDLCQLSQSLGFTNVSSYLLTGNILFDSDKPPEFISRQLSQAIHNAFGYGDVDIVVLDRERLQKIIAAAPDEAKDESGWHITFLVGSPSTELKNKMNGDEYHPDKFIIGNDVIYVHCPNGYGRTKINNSYFEKKLNVRATTRNMKTVNALNKLIFQ